MPINVTMPALSPTMEEGTLAKWLVAEGDTVESGDVIAEIETDKATMEVEAVDEGTIGKIVIGEGSEGVKVNAVIAVLLEEGESANDISNSVILSESEGSRDTQGDSSSMVPPQNDTILAPPAQKGDRVFASPLARRIAKDKGLDLAAIQGTGPRGRIVKRDVENAQPGAAPATAQASPAAAPTPSQPSAPAGEPDIRGLVTAYGMEFEEIPANNIKKITAKRLQESKSTVPHFYLTIDCQIDELLAFRKKINDKADGAYKVSVNDIIVKACAQALQAYPAANVAWAGDAVLQFKHSDISIAVATPNGLMTPIVKHAEGKGLQKISSEIKDMATRAKDGKLAPEEFQGGTFTVSNLGMFGVKEFSAIINPPQSCILAVGAGVQTPVVVDGAVAIKTVMTCTLSTDHRTVDGAVGAEFLQILKRYIEDPMTMLV